MPALELDLTAESSDNFIPGEERSLTGGASVIIPNNGYFYDKDFEIINAANNQPLVRGTDYVLQEPINTPYKLPYAAYLVIRLLNANIDNVIIDYRAIGDWYGLTTASLSNIAAFANGTASFQWGDILNIPTEFFPQPHLHHASEINWGGAVEGLAAIAQTIGGLNGAALESLYQYINDRTSNLEYYGNGVDMSWGAIRNNATGFTLNWGTLPEDESATAQSAGGARWRSFFKKEFTVSSDGPAIIVAGSNGKYAPFELESIDETDFTHIVKYDPANPSTAVARRTYYAIGLSSSGTAVANTPFVSA